MFYLYLSPKLRMPSLKNRAGYFVKRAVVPSIQVVLVACYLSNLYPVYYQVFQSPNGHLISFLTKSFSSLM